jgi:hypothetical protein
MQIKTVSLCIKLEEQAGFDTAIEEVVAGQRDVATDVVDSCQRRGLWLGCKKVTGLDTTRRGVVRLCDSDVYRQCNGRCQWLRRLRRGSAAARLLGLLVRTPPNKKDVCLL